MCNFCECMFYYLVQLSAILQLQEQHCDNISEKSAQVRLFGDTIAVRTVSDQIILFYFILFFYFFFFFFFSFSNNVDIKDDYIVDCSQLIEKRLRKTRNVDFQRGKLVISETLL